MTGHMIQMRINQPSKGETPAEKGEHLAIEALQSVRAIARNAFEEQLLKEYVSGATFTATSSYSITNNKNNHKTRTKQKCKTNMSRIRTREAKPARKRTTKNNSLVFVLNLRISFVYF